MRHDALWGVYKAWETYEGRTEFQPYLEAYCWWSIKRGMRKILDREDIARFDSIERQQEALLDGDHVADLFADPANRRRHPSGSRRSMPGRGATSRPVASVSSLAGTHSPSGKPSRNGRWR
jgi:hypothetical protein